jgi:hypothetical protein
VKYRAKIVNIEAFEFQPSKPFPHHIQPDKQLLSKLKLGDFLCRDQQGKMFVMDRESFENAYEVAEREISSFGMSGKW